MLRVRDLTLCYEALEEKSSTVPGTITKLTAWPRDGCGKVLRWPVACYHGDKMRTDLKDKRVLDHVALAVKSLSRATDLFRAIGCSVDDVQEFEAEGSREAYVGEGRPRLLLQQPMDGRSHLAMHLKRRGAGVHHVGLCVPNLENACEGLRGSGWLLTPRSLVSSRSNGTIWLTRPEVGLLVEVREEMARLPSKGFIQEVGIASSNYGFDLGLLRALIPQAVNPRERRSHNCQVREFLMQNAMVTLWHNQGRSVGFFRPLSDAPTVVKLVTVTVRDATQAEGVLRKAATKTISSESGTQSLPTIFRMEKHLGDVYLSVVSA